MNKRDVWITVGMICVVIVVLCVITMGILGWIFDDLTQMQLVKRFWYVSITALVSAIVLLFVRERL